MNLILLYTSLLIGQSPEASLSLEQVRNNYCGLYCVQAIATLKQISIPMESLLVDKYLSEFASTSGQLQSALRDNGIPAVARSGLNLTTLRSAKHPLILHVKSTPLATRYHHWMVFLGFNTDGTAKVYDPPGYTLHLSSAEVLSLWDGVGLIIEPEARLLDRIHLPWEWLCLIPALFVGLLLTAKWRMLLRITFVSLMTSFIYHIVSPVGFIQEPASVGNVTAREQAWEIPIINYEQMQINLKNSNTVLYDVRIDRDFKRQSIPGAISLPVSSGFSVLRSHYQNHDKKQNIIFFCQSESCTWSHEIATVFASQGFRNLSIYKGGFYEWQSRQKNSAGEP
jgi:rhodanese-related sulfurtransferase